MRRTLLPILALLLIFSVTVWAEESRKGQNLSAGKALIKSGNYAEAVAVLKKAVAEAPDDPEANLCLGMALNGLADKEAETYLKRSLMEIPDDPATNFELGLVYYQKKNYAEAVDYFENTQLLAPGSEYSLKARQLMRKMDEKAQGKRWEVAFLTGFQYDSNVILNGTTTPLPAGYSGKSDWRAIINLAGHYSFYKTDVFDFKGGYSLYQSFHTNLDKFNVTRNLFDLSATYTVSPKIKLDALYSFEYLLVAGDQYDYGHNIGPSLVIKHGDWGTSSLEYRYNNTTFTNSTQYNNNSDRNGDNHLVNLIHILPLGKSAAVWASYGHDENLTRTRIWDYSGDKWLVGVRTALPFGCIGDLSGEYYHRAYGGFTPGSGTRDDKQYSMSVSLTKNITEDISLVLNELYTRNQSNMKIYEYERSITGLFVNVRFHD